MAYEVRGYLKPESEFRTIEEWQDIAREFLQLQSKGVDTRGGILPDDPKIGQLVTKYFGWLYHNEAARYELLTEKNVLDFIEDFVNHKVWFFPREFGDLFADFTKLRYAWFYSRGDIEPYVLLDSEFVQQTYGTERFKVESYHWTSELGLENLRNRIVGKRIALSTFTHQFKKFFRKESTTLVKLQGYLVAGFRSDVKSFATDTGLRAANLYRMINPGGVPNLCTDLECTDENGTYLWNEIVIYPTNIIGINQSYESKI